MEDVVYFSYRNHRGEISRRKVRLLTLVFRETPGYDYQPGWFLHCWDLEKNAHRDFALSHIVLEGHNFGICLTPTTPVGAPL